MIRYFLLTEVIARRYDRMERRAKRRIRRSKYGLAVRPAYDLASGRKEICDILDQCGCEYEIFDGFGNDVPYVCVLLSPRPEIGFRWLGENIVHMADRGTVAYYTRHGDRSDRLDSISEKFRKIFDKKGP